MSCIISLGQQKSKGTLQKKKKIIVCVNSLTLWWFIASYHDFIYLFQANLIKGTENSFHTLLKT